MTSQRLAVIGGGIAGHRIAFAMRQRMEVTLIDPKTYFEIPMALPRLLVEPDALRARLPYQDFLSGARFIQGRATAISDGAVTVACHQGGEQQIDFDHAVVAVGSRYSDPLIKAEACTEAERADEIASMHAHLAKARHVVIVGGGAVGIEIAGELAETLPNLEVTLLHSGPRLLEAAPSKFSGWATEFLRKRNIAYVLGDPVISPAIGNQPTDGFVATASGRRVAADAVVWAVGIKPATEFVVASWPGAVEPDGRIKVDRFLRVEGHPSVFAVGDTTNLTEARFGLIARFHSNSVIANLQTLARATDANPARLRPYRPKTRTSPFGRVMIVTLGRRDGLTSLPFGQLRAPFIARQLKAKDMLVGLYRRGVGF